MTTIEYSEYKNEFLLTGYTADTSKSFRLCFLGVKNGTVHIGNNDFLIENGIATVKISLLKDGEYTPVLHSKDGSFPCDKIEIIAETAAPKTCDSKRLIYLTKQFIEAHEKTSKLEKKLLELCDAVYGKSIL